MAVLFSQKINSTLYEVRTAGKTLRLYSNGIFHSQWNPSRPLSGHLWDLLSIPAFFLDLKLPKTTRKRRATILGVGGGAVINSLNTLFNFDEITGVDLDPTHLYLAKRFFGCKKSNTSLIHDEARHYTRSDRKKVDYIVEDLFIENPKIKSDAKRAIQADQSWFNLLLSRLTTRGILVANFESEQQLKSCLASIKLPASIHSAYLFQMHRYENAVLVLSKPKLSFSDFEISVSEALGERDAFKVLNSFSTEKLR